MMCGTEERTPAVGFSATTPTSSSLQQPPSQSTKQSSATRFTRPSTACTHCGRTGNDSASCFQVKWFTEWWTDKTKTNGGRGAERSARGRGSDMGRGCVSCGSGFRTHNTMVCDTFSQEESQTSGIPNFTPDHWTTLENFINSKKRVHSRSFRVRETNFICLAKIANMMSLLTQECHIIWRVILIYLPMSTPLSRVQLRYRMDNAHG